MSDVLRADVDRAKIATRYQVLQSVTAVQRWWRSEYLN